MGARQHAQTLDRKKHVSGARAKVPSLPPLRFADEKNDSVMLGHNLERLSEQDARKYIQADIERITSRVNSFTNQHAAPELAPEPRPETELRLLRRLNHLTSSVRDYLQPLFRTISEINGKDPKGKRYGADIISHRDTHGEVWDADLSRWYAQAKAAAAGYEKIVESIKKTLEDRYPTTRTVTLYSSKGDEMTGVVSEITSDKTNIYVKFIPQTETDQETTTGLTFSIEAFERMLQRPTEKGPRFKNDAGKSIYDGTADTQSTENQQVTAHYIERAFGSTLPEGYQIMARGGNRWKIRFHTQSGREYTIWSTLEKEKNGSDIDYALKINKIDDWQNIFGSQFAVYKNDKLTPAILQDIVRQAEVSTLSWWDLLGHVPEGTMRLTRRPFNWLSDKLWSKPVINKKPSHLMRQINDRRKKSQKS